MNIPTPFGPIHWCIHETQMFLMMLPFLGGVIFWVRSKFKKEVKAHHDCCHTKENDPCK